MGEETASHWSYDDAPSNLNEVQFSTLNSFNSSSVRLQDMCAVFAAEAATHCSGRITPFQVRLGGGTRCVALVWEASALVACLLRWSC